MKKQFYVFIPVVLALVTTTYAQVTINSSDIITPGNQLIQANDYNPDASITPGGTGASQTWDFTAFVEDDLDTVLCVSPAGKPKSSDYPTATMAITSTTEVYSWVFISNTSTELQTLGLVIIDEFSMDTISIEFNQRFLTFPSSLNTKFTDNAPATSNQFELGIDPDGPGGHPMVDSINISSSTTTESDMDAEGSLMLPGGTFNSLRQHLISTSTDSVFMFANGVWSPLSPTMEAFMGMSAVETYETETYRWWSNDAGTGFVLVEFEVEPGTTNIEEGGATWLKASTVGVEKHNSVTSHIFPNPASDVLNIRLDAKENGVHYLELYDVSGKIAGSFTIYGNQGQVNLDQITNGMYFYQVLGKDGKVISNGKISVSK